MIKNNQKLIIGIAIGCLLSYYIFKKSNEKIVSTDADIIIEKLKSVKKIIVTEGYFSEIYSHTEAQQYFYNLISFEKKALLLVKGKVQINYDLGKMKYEVNNSAKEIHVSSVPAPEISIEPSIKYYDLQESTFNSFGTDDYNKLNATAVDKLKKEIAKSDLKNVAKKSLATALQDMQWVGKELGWKVIIDE